VAAARARDAGSEGLKPLCGGTGGGLRYQPAPLSSPPDRWEGAGSEITQHICAIVVFAVANDIGSGVGGVLDLVVD